MEKDNCTKQQDIDFIVELLRKQSPEKIREVLVFIQCVVKPLALAMGI